MIELKRHVERIVRPIRANGLRKDRMREELLAHLTHLYDQEATARHGDENAALAAAIARFGDPSTLRAELQATVPMIERVLFARLAAGPVVARSATRRPGESVWAHMRRTAPWAMGFSAIFWIGLVAFIAMVKHGRLQRANEASLVGLIEFGAGFVFLLPIFVYGPMLVCDRIRLELDNASSLSRSARRAMWLRIAGYTALNQAIYGGGFGLLLVLINRLVSIEVLAPVWICGIMAAWAAAALPMTAIQVVELRRFEEWGSLNVDDAPTASVAATRQSGQ
jgi:hypothetical protein